MPLPATASLLKEYRSVFVRLQGQKVKLEDLRKRKTQFDKEFDYNQFQFNELDDAGFKENELEDIETELKMLTNAEGIKTALAKTYFELEESDEPVSAAIENTTWSASSIC